MKYFSIVFMSKISFSHLLTAAMAASLVREVRSAPTYPGVRWARLSRSAPASSRRLRHSTPRICRRAAVSGIPSAISRSKRPARLSAGSIVSALVIVN